MTPVLYAQKIVLAAVPERYRSVAATFLGAVGLRPAAAGHGHARGHGHE